jgi:hypothetical protein
MPNHENQVFDLTGIGLSHNGQKKATKIFLDTLVVEGPHIFGYQGGKEGAKIIELYLDEGELSITDRGISSTTGLKIKFYKCDAYLGLHNILKRCCPMALDDDRLGIYNDRMLGHLKEKLTEKQFTDIRIQLFCSIWVRQVIYYILDSGEDQIHEKFVEKFPYPLFKQGEWTGYTNPNDIIRKFSDHKDVFKKKALYKKYLNIYWKPVARWLKKINKEDNLMKAKDEFKKDFNARIRNFPDELSWIIGYFNA